MNSLGSLSPRPESQKPACRELALFNFNHLLLIPLILLVSHDVGRVQRFMVHAFSRLWVHSLFQEEISYHNRTSIRTNLRIFVLTLFHD